MLLMRVAKVDHLRVAAQGGKCEIPDVGPQLGRHMGHQSAKQTESPIQASLHLSSLADQGGVFREREHRRKQSEYLTAVRGMRISRRVSYSLL
jgi:hypothetical protein